MRASPNSGQFRTNRTSSLSARPSTSGHHPVTDQCGKRNQPDQRHCAPDFQDVPCEITNLHLVQSDTRPLPGPFGVVIGDCLLSRHLEVTTDLVGAVDTVSRRRLDTSAGMPLGSARVLSSGHLDRETVRTRVYGHRCRVCLLRGHDPEGSLMRESAQWPFHLHNCNKPATPQTMT